MALRDLITFNRAVGGIRDTVQNIASIRTARQALEKKREIDDLTIQKKKIDIQGQSLLYDWNKMEIDRANADIKEREKISKAETTAVSGRIDITEIGEKSKLSQLQNVAKTSMLMLDDNDMAALMGMGQARQEPEYSNVAGNLNPNLPRYTLKNRNGMLTRSYDSEKKTKTTTSSVDKVMGEIDLGSKLQDGEEVPFESREEVEKHATRQLGYGWKTKYPQAMQLIDSRFPQGWKPKEERETIKGPKASFGQKVLNALPLGGKKSGSPKVLIKLPDGSQWRVQKENLDEAIKRGATIIR